MNSYSARCLLHASCSLTDNQDLIHGEKNHVCGDGHRPSWTPSLSKGMEVVGVPPLLEVTREENSEREEELEKERWESIMAEGGDVDAYWRERRRVTFSVSAFEHQDKWFIHLNKTTAESQPHLGTVVYTFQLIKFWRHVFLTSKRQ